MTITPALSVYSPYAIQQTSDLASALLGANTQTAAGFVGNSAIVELSGLGQLLAATDVFQANLAALQPGSTSSGLGQNFGTDFGSLAAEAQNFVDTFNTLQNTLANLQGASGPLFGDTLTAQFSQALTAQATATIGNGTAAPNSLADIGITLQAPSDSAAGGTLSIDLQALQSAYSANPSGTFSLLDQAAQSLGGVAANFAGQAGVEAATLGAVAQFSSELLLLGSGLTGSNTLSLTDLLALSSLNSGSALTLTQQVLALNEFNLVSTLIS